MFHCNKVAMALSVHERFRNVRAQLEEPLDEQTTKSVQAARQGVYRPDGKSYEDILFKHVEFGGRQVRVLKPEPVVPRGNQQHDPMKKNHDAFIGLMTGDARLMGDTERAYRMKRGGTIQLPIGLMQSQNVQAPTDQDASTESRSAERHRRADALRMHIGEADKVRPVTGRTRDARDLSIAQQFESSTSTWRMGRETQEALMHRGAREEFAREGVPALTIPQYASRDSEVGPAIDEDRRRVTVLSERDLYDIQEGREYDDADEVGYVTREPVVSSRRTSFREHGTNGRIAIDTAPLPTQGNVVPSRAPSHREEGTQQGTTTEGLDKNPSGDHALAVSRLLSSRERDQRPARWSDSMGDQSGLHLPGSRPVSEARALTHREYHSSGQLQGTEGVSAVGIDFAKAQARRASFRDGTLQGSIHNEYETTLLENQDRPSAHVRTLKNAALLKASAQTDAAIDLGDAPSSMARKVSSRVRTEVRGSRPTSDLVGTSVDVLGDLRERRATLEESARAANRMSQMAGESTTRIQRARARTNAIRESDPSVVRTMDRRTQATRGGDRAHVLAGQTSWEAHARTRMRGLESHIQAAERARQAGPAKMPFYESEAETDYDSELD